MSKNKLIPQPWQKPFYNSFGIIRLHEEIIDFCNYIKPTLLEDKVRLYVVDKVKKVIQARWPTSSVHVFGSFATNLYLPTSDIDMVLFGEWDYNPLWTVERILRENDVSTDIRVISKATVPIVKFTEKETGIFVDISFNKDNGLKAVPIIRQYLTDFTHLEKLFVILKYFMLQRDLNEVWTGGLGSYSLMLLCVSFLQHYNKNYSGDMNLGCLLMEFFELYGRTFNFLNTSISVNGKGSYKMKYDNPNGQKMSFISIEDPIEPGNDVTRGCYGLFNIRLAFSNAYSKLYSKVTPSCLSFNNGSAELRNDESALASIITVREEIIEFRRRIIAKFGFLINYKGDQGVSSVMTTSKYCENKKEITSESRTSNFHQNKDIFTITKRVKQRKHYGRTGSALAQNITETSVRRTRKASKKIPDHVLKKLPKHVVKKVNKARNWSDLAEWSQDNVFNLQR